MAVASLAVRLSAQIAEFQSAFKETSKTINKFSSDFEGAATRASAVGTFIGNIATDIAKSIASGLGSAAKDAVRLSSEFSNAFTGLSSVSRAFGTDAGLARDAAKALAQDGLLPVKDAAAGLKNLLAAGFSLPEATKLMNAFKDSAAFGRQGALSFGDAIRQATEGVKNGNSILVDNAGITKNLSVILKEAGFSAQELAQASSNAGVRQALFNGILKEAAAFAGDAEKATATYSGQVIRLGTAYDTLLASLGDAVTQNLTVAKALGFVSEQLTGLTTSLSGNRQGFNLVSEAVIVFVKALSSVLNVVDLVQTGFAGLQQFVNRAGIALSNFGLTYLAVAEKANSAMRFLDPMNYDRYSLALREAKEATTFLEGAVKGFSEASKDAQTRSSEFGNKLQGMRASLTTLATELDKTRGKTIEFGASGKPAGTAFAAGMAAVTKETKAATKAIDEFLVSVRKQAAADVRSHQMTAMMRELTAAVKAQRVELQQLYIPAVNNWASANQATTATLLEMVRAGQVFKAEFSAEDFHDLASGTTTAASTIRGEFSSIGQTLGRDVASIFADGIVTGDWSQFQNNLKDTLSGALGAGAAAAVNAFVPGLGTILQPLFTAFSDKLLGFLGLGTKGRDLVKDFAAGFEGGFDGLREKLNALGAEGERLWVNLTQRVGKNNADQAKSAIAAIESAFEAHKVKALETEALIAAAQQREADAIDAATANVRSRIQSLDSEYQSLFKSIENEAPEEVMGIVEAATRARMAAVQQQSEEAKREEDEITQKIKENMGTIGIVARDAARELTDAFGNIIIPPVRVPIEWVIPGLPSQSKSLVLPGGGAGTSPAFVPTGKSFGGQVPVNLYLDGELVATNTTKHQSKRIRIGQKVGVR